jgi:dihydropyrimidinase
MKDINSAVLIQGGTLVLPDGLLSADLLIEAEQIKAVGQNLPATDDVSLLDATGCFVLPGVIDSHTHIQLDTGIYKTPDDWFSGTSAAARGGVTTIIDFATQFAGQSLRKAVDTRLNEAKDAVIDYGFHVMVTDLPPGEEDRLGQLVELGTPSVKLYTTYRPNYYADDATILRLIETCADLGILPLVHCENDSIVTAYTERLIEGNETGWQFHGQSRPPIAEQEAIQRVLFLAEAANCPIHICHCSTALSVALVAEARDNGQAVSCETCPQYLLLDMTVYDGPEPWRYILQPPLRAPGEGDGLWALIEAGAVDTIVTDHCDYTKEQKLASDSFYETPGGLPGLETLLPLMYTGAVAKGQLTLTQLSEMLSANPARIWGLWPQKGALLPGSDADVVIYNPEPNQQLRADNLAQGAGYTPYKGVEVHGQVKATVSRGQVIYLDGQFQGERGRGHFLSRKIGTRSIQETKL